MSISSFDPLKLLPESKPDPEFSQPDSECDSSPNPSLVLLHLAFNPDHTCFSAATSSGLRAFSCDPFRHLLLSPSAPRGTFRFVQMLSHSHIFAFLSGGPHPRSPPSLLSLWDDRRSCFVGEVKFRSQIISVKLRIDMVVVVLLNKVFLYGLKDMMNPVDAMMTLDNPKGLCEVSQKPCGTVVACPGLHEGQVRVNRYRPERSKFISAHTSGLTCFALTLDGEFLATASRKGTLIRVFNTSDGTLLHEVRRGADRAEIHCLAFSSNAQWLAASSNKGTVHVFSSKVDLGCFGDDGGTSEISCTNASAVSSLSYFKAVLPSYFSSEWSVARFRLEEGVKYIVAFGHQKNTVIIVGMDGSFYRCQFDPTTVGVMTQLEHSNFLKSE